MKARSPQTLGAAIVMGLFLLTGAVEAEADSSASALDHRAIREILSMVEADVAAGVILARIARMEKIPELTGEEIAELKRRGVPDRVLLALVRATAPVGAAGGRGEVVSDGLARIRVVLHPAFGISYAEVRLAGSEAAIRGAMLTGESERAHFLKRPENFGAKKPVMLYEGDREPGSYDVSVGYAVTQVESDPDDVFSEYSREAYRSSGVGLRGTPIREESDGSWTDAPAARCEIVAGQVCEVHVTPERTPRGRRTGTPVYSLIYRVEVR